MEVLRRHHAKNPARDTVSQVQYLDMKTYLVGDINGDGVVSFADINPFVRLLSQP